METSTLFRLVVSFCENCLSSNVSNDYSLRDAFDLVICVLSCFSFVPPCLIIKKTEPYSLLGTLRRLEKPEYLQLSNYAQYCTSHVHVNNISVLSQKGNG